MKNSEWIVSKVSSKSRTSKKKDKVIRITSKRTVRNFNADSLETRIDLEGMGL